MRLQGKIFLLFVVAAILLGGPLLWTVWRAVRQVDMEDVTARGVLKVTELAERLTPHFSAGQETALLPFLQATQEQTGALYVAALNLSGHVLAHTNVAEKGRVYRDADSQAALRLDKPEGHVVSYKNSPIMEVNAPVWSGAPSAPGEDYLFGAGEESSRKVRLGVVRLGLPLDQVLQREKEFIRRIAQILLVAGGSGVLVLFVSMRYILRPIGWLASATGRIAQGDYKVAVPIHSNDELGDLAVAFNRMSEELRESHQATMKIMQDLTEAKIETDELNNTLEKKVDERTHELKEATVQLVQSEKLAALGELTAGVAHELNQPLNCMKVMAQSNLRDMEKNRFEMDVLKSDLGEIVKQVDRMAEIINHMRIFTRKQSGVVLEETDLNVVLAGPFKLLGQQLQLHGIEVVRDLLPDLPRVRTDGIQLEQVLINLLGNAKDAIGHLNKEPRRITVQSRLREGPPRGAVLTISDTGGGVPKELRLKIFEPFFTTKEPGKGTGLGLSISKKIVEELGGRLELSVREGEGSDFSIVLPIAKA
jgi:signal transduction histidine kinase